MACEKDEIELTIKIKRYKKLYDKYRNDTKKDVKKIKRKIIYDNKNIESAKTLFCGSDFGDNSISVFGYKDIFPLKQIEFEGDVFYAPNLEKKYLEKVYGEYMEFPRYNFEKYTVRSERLLHSSMKYNMDMNEIITELTRILEAI